MFLKRLLPAVLLLVLLLPTWAAAQGVVIQDPRSSNRKANVLQCSGDTTVDCLAVELSKSGAIPTYASTAPGATEGLGSQWFTGNQGAPVVGFFQDDVTVQGFHPTTTTSMSIYQSNDGGQAYALTRTVSGFPASSFGELLQVVGPTSSGRVFLVMLSATGGMSYTTSLAGGVGSWAIGPAGGGTQDGIAMAQGPNGTLVYMRESGGVGQTCRSTDDGTTWACQTFLGSGSVGIAASMASPVAGTWMFVNSNSVFRSTDDGRSFVRHFSPTNGANGLGCITATTCLLAAGGVSSATIYRTTDAGLTWSLVITLPITWSTTDAQGSIPIINFGSGVVVLLTGNTLTAASAGVRSTDSGLTWTTLPVWNVVPGGTNSRSYRGTAVRGQRAIAFHRTTENIYTQMYSTAPGGAEPQTVVKSGLSEGCAGQSFTNTIDTNVSVAASTQLITGISGRRIYICHVDLVATGGANNVVLVEGTGAVCATGIGGLFGGVTAATGWGLAANGQIVIGNGQAVVRRTTAPGDNICILVSAATQVSGLIRWAQY